MPDDFDSDFLPLEFDDDEAKKTTRKPIPLGQGFKKKEPVAEKTPAAEISEPATQVEKPEPVDSSKPALTPPPIAASKEEKTPEVKPPVQTEDKSKDVIVTLSPASTPEPNVDAKETDAQKSSEPVKGKLVASGAAGSAKTTEKKPIPLGSLAAKPTPEAQPPATLTKVELSTHSPEKKPIPLGSIAEKKEDSKGAETDKKPIPLSANADKVTDKISSEKKPIPLGSIASSVAKEKEKPDTVATDVPKPDVRPVPLANFAKRDTTSDPADRKPSDSINKPDAKKEPVKLTKVDSPVKAEEKQPKKIDPVVANKDKSSSKLPGVPAKEKKPLRVLSSVAKNASIGRILQEARVCCKYSVSQVEQATKIKREYLEAIEHDDFKHLPPPVYVAAYVKNLCSFYNIDPKETKEILANLKDEHKGRAVPDELLHHLESEKQINYDEEQKMRRVFMMTAAVVAIAVIGAVISIMLTSKGNPENGKPAPDAPTPPPGSNVRFTSDQFEGLVPRYTTIQITELEITGR